MTQKKDISNKIILNDKIYRTIVQQSPISTQIFSPDGETIYVNKAWEKLWGISRKEITGFNVLKDKQLVKKGIMPFIKKGFSGEMTDIPTIKYEPHETLDLKKAVQYKWVKAKIYPITNEEGIIQEIILQHEDITLQKDVEEQLKENEQRFRAMFNHANIAMSIADSKGSWMIFNNLYPKLFGYTEKELQTMHPSQLIHPADLEKSTREYKRLITGKINQLVQERRYLHKNGTIVYGIVHASVVYGDDKKLKYVVVAIEDITSRKLYEDALFFAKSQQDVILENIADAVTMQDASGKIIYANEKAALTSGYATVDEMLRAPLFDYVKRFHMFDEHNNPFPFDKLPGRRALVGEKNAGTLLKIVDKKTKETRWVNVKSTVILDKQKKPCLIINTMQDLTERKLAEERILSSEAKFKKFFDANIIGVFTSTLDGKFLEANDVLLHMIGFSREDLEKGKIHRDKLTPPEFKSLSKSAVTSLITNGISETYEKEYIRKDGKRIPVLIAVARIGDSDTCVGFILDITERKKAEESQAYMASIVRSSEDAIVSKTLQGIITSWNRGAEKIFGYTPDEAIGKHITLIIPPYLYHEETEIISKIRKGHAIEHFETIRMRKDGTMRNISLTVSPIRDKKGKIIGASKIARDITDRKKAETALAESEERLRLALNAGNIGVWDWNLKENYLMWTDNLFPMHGVEKGKFNLTFDSYLSLIHPDDKNFVRDSIENALKHKKSFAIDLRIITPAGEMKWFSTSARIFNDIDNKPIRMLGAVSDITQQKQLEQEKSDFLSMASHELKTPLTSMKMFIDLLSRHVKDIELEKPKYFVTRIKDQADRLTELTNDLLDVSRIETGKLQLHKEHFNLNDLILDTVESIQPAANAHKLIVKEKEPITVFGDRYRVYQVIVNLLTNAIKYSPDGKRIIVSLKKEDNDAIISVKDYGIGIHKKEYNRIFERLYQTSDHKEKTYPGLGLGLYISKEIVERHKGKIWVNSKKGEGSTFYFSIPLGT